MIIYSKVIDIFFLVDEFCKEYEQIVDNHLLGNPSKRPSIMSKSEVITIIKTVARSCVIFNNSLYFVYGINASPNLSR